jgi:hypothetical protein
VNDTASQSQHHLHLVPSPQGAPSTENPAEARFAEPGDLALLGVLLAIGAFPLAGELAGGRWGKGTLGAAAALAFLSGRELLTQLRSYLRARP